MCLCHSRHRTATIIIFRGRLRFISKCHVLCFDLSAEQEAVTSYINNYPPCWLKSMIDPQGKKSVKMKDRLIIAAI